MEEIRERYNQACKEYIESEMKKEEVIGILVTGSFLYSTIDKNSDIDVHVILSPSCDYRIRGNLWINGIEIEYFKNPPAQILSYFKKEKTLHSAYMFTYGEVVYDQAEIMDELVATATAIIEQKPPELTAFQIELAKYFIDDYYKDFEDAVENDDFPGAKILRDRIVNKCIDVFCNLHQIRRQKDKRLSKQIKQLDPAFNQKIVETLSEKWNETTSLILLRSATEKLLGGPRTKVWKLKSKLDL